MVLVAFYILVVLLGILSMGFQLLASRLLGPHFGSGLDVWAWLISTFLAAFSLGSMAGGWISSRSPRVRWRATLVVSVVGLLALFVTARFGHALLNRIEMATLDAINLGLFFSCTGLFFVPVLAISTFGPQNVQFLAARGMAPGVASGLVYGVSTLGNIAGVMLTSLVLIPHFGVTALVHAWLYTSILGLSCLVLILRTALRS